MSTQTRQLAVIMFSDLVGFTTLMGEDEEKAMSLLKINRDIHKKTIKKHHGKWVKELGDGNLSSFHTITDAVYCAGEIIQLSQEHEITLRIGIHFGEVMEEDGDIFGDGVNVASRLEPLAKPNQILVSDPIHKNIKNKHGIKSTFIEEKHLKNVDEPVRIYSVEVEDFSSNHNQKEISTVESILSKRVLISVASLVVIALVIVFYFKPWSKAESTNDSTINTNTINSIAVLPFEKTYSIAVLPFKDMSPDHDMEYLSDGISEEIINMLTKVKGLKVIGRTSSFSFKGKDTDIKTIGEILGVEMVLEGSVMKSGNQLRITAQLINAEDGFHIWSERFDKPFTEIFALQDELTRSVVSMINENLVSDKGNTLDDKGTDNPEAYETYLKGEFVAKRYYDSWQVEDFDLAEIYYKSAIALDSNFALPYISLSVLCGSRLSVLISDENKQRHQEYEDLFISYFNKGYALNPNDEKAIAIKGAMFEEIDSDSVYFYAKKSLSINPKNSDILAGFADWYSQIGLKEQGLLLYNKAIDIDPLTIRAISGRGFIYLISLSDFDKAEIDFEEVLNLSPNHANSIYAMFFLNAQKGNYQETMRYLSKMHESNLEDAYFTNFIFFLDSLTNALFAIEGKEKLVPSIESIFWENLPPTMFISLGMYDETLANLEKLVSDNPNMSYYTLLSKNPLLEPIRNEPRFKKLLEINRIRQQELEAKYGNLDFLDL